MGRLVRSRSPPQLGHLPGSGEDLFQGVGGVGVVNEDRIGRRDGDHLHPPLHPWEGGKGFGDPLQGAAQVTAAGNHPQGVAHGNAPGQREVHLTALLPRFHLEPGSVWPQADAPGRNVRLPPGLGEGDPLTGGGPGKGSAGPVV